MIKTRPKVIGGVGAGLWRLFVGRKIGGWTRPCHL